MRIYYLFLLGILLGCASQKYSLEKNPRIQVEDAYYKEVPPAIKDGKVTTQVYIELQENDRNIVAINGIFFKGQYLKQKDNAKPLVMSTFISNKNPSLDPDFPFDLKNTEFVIDYQYNNKRKFALFPISRKLSLDDIPR